MREGEKWILVCDEVSRGCVVDLQKAGFGVHYAASLIQDDLYSAIQNYHGVIVRSRTEITADLIKIAANLKIIARAGKGFDKIDIDAASRKDILVVNAPGGNEISVAEHVVGLMVCLLKRIPYADREFKKRRWVKSEICGKEIRGKTLGIIGYGKIGRILAEIANGLGMKILAHDKFVKIAEAYVGLTDFDTLLRESDIVSLHIPEIAETLGLFNSKTFAKMKKGAYLINTSRGGIVDEVALAECLASGHLAGAALDVFKKEPPRLPYPDLYEMDNFIATPHIAGQTEESEERIGKRIAETVRLYLEEGIIRDAVNADCIDMERFSALEPYRILAKRLVAFLSQYCGTPQRIDVYFGEEFQPNEIQILTRIIIRESLGIGYVSSFILAKDKGIQWQAVERSLGAKKVGISFSSNGKMAKAVGRIDEDGVPVLIGVDDFSSRGIPLSGSFLIFVNKNVPGVWAQVTEVLSKHLNIDEMIGKSQKEHLAFAAITVKDGVIPDHVLKKVWMLPQICSAHKITLR